MHIKPLYFPVTVRSVEHKVREALISMPIPLTRFAQRPNPPTPECEQFGTEYAISQLRANNFLNSNGRQIVSSCLDDYFQLDSLDECNSVKRLLLTVYYALPLGSLDTGVPLTGNENIFDAICELPGWNEFLEQVWRAEGKCLIFCHEHFTSLSFVF